MQLSDALLTIERRHHKRALRERAFAVLMTNASQFIEATITAAVQTSTQRGWAVMLDSELSRLSLPLTFQVGDIKSALADIFSSAELALTVTDKTREAVRNYAQTLDATAMRRWMNGLSDQVLASMPEVQAIPWRPHHTPRLLRVPAAFVRGAIGTYLSGEDLLQSSLAVANRAWFDSVQFYAVQWCAHWRSTLKRAGAFWAACSQYPTDKALPERQIAATHLQLPYELRPSKPSVSFARVHTIDTGYALLATNNHRPDKIATTVECLSRSPSAVRHLRVLSLPVIGTVPPYKLYDFRNLDTIVMVFLTASISMWSKQHINRFFGANAGTMVFDVPHLAVTNTWAMLLGDTYLARVIKKRPLPVKKVVLHYRQRTTNSRFIISTYKKALMQLCPPGCEWAITYHPDGYTSVGKNV